MKRILIALCAFSIPFTASVSPTEATNLPCPQYHKLMRQNGLPLKEMAWIMHRESKCVARAVGWNYYPGKDHTDCRSGEFKKHRRCKAVKSYDLGLMQINYATWDDLTTKLCGKKSTTLLRPSCNLKVAGEIYRQYGSAPWKGNSNG